MQKFHTLVLAAALSLASGVAMAQSVGNGGNPGAANTTDPDSAPHTRNMHPGHTTTGMGLDAAGRANTSVRIAT
jgi:hypothetical protein